MPVYGFNSADDARRLLRLLGKHPADGRPPNFRTVPDEHLFRNNTGETVPAFAPMRVTGSDDMAEGIGFTIAKPDDTEGRFIFNGVSEVADGGIGTCSTARIVRAASTGSVSAGMRVGVDGWAVKEGGFPDLAGIVLGGYDTDVVWLWVEDQPNQSWFKSPGGGIGAGSGGTPGSATCDRARWTGSVVVEYSSPSYTATVKNLSSLAVAADTFILCARVDGAWFAHFEPCPPAE